MALQDAITWLNTQIAAISGVDVAAVPTENIGVNGLIAMIYDASGTLTSDDHLQARDLSAIRILLIYPGQDLRQAVTVLAGKPQLIANKIRTDPTFDG